MLRRWPTFLAASILLVAACAQDDSATTAIADSSTTQSAEPTTTIDQEVATTASAVTIMHIGGGLTQGGGDHSTYRCFLDTLLHDAGVVFDFVGSRQKPADGYDYTCPTDFDQDHEAWAGAQVGGLETEMMTASVEALQPDVALVHLGGFDVWKRGEPLVTAGRLELFITGLQAVSPDITLLIAQMIPCVTPLPWCTEDYPALSDAIASFGSLSTDESTVMAIDMHTGVSTDLLRPDNLSFTDAGDEVLASRWMDALEESGVITASS